MQLMSAGLALIAACRAAAQPDAPAPGPIEHAADGLAFDLTAGIWLPRLGGEVKLGPSPASDEISIENDLDLDSSEAVGNFELSVRKNDRWQLNFSGFDFSTESSGAFPGSNQFGSLSLAPGTAFSASFDMTSLEADLVYWAWQPRRIRPLPDGTVSRLDLRAGPMVGLRYIDVDHTVGLLAGPSQSAGGEWIVPLAGLQFQMRYDLPDSVPLFETLQADLGAGFGPALGGEGGTMAQVRAGITLLPCDNFGLSFGYRLVELGVENDQYQFHGGLQGLFFAATFRF